MCWDKKLFFNLFLCLDIPCFFIWEPPARDGRRRRRRRYRTHTSYNTTCKEECGWWWRARQKSHYKGRRPRNEFAKIDVSTNHKKILMAFLLCLLCSLCFASKNIRLMTDRISPPPYHPAFCLFLISLKGAISPRLTYYDNIHSSSLHMKRREEKCCCCCCWLFMPPPSFLLPLEIDHSCAYPHLGCNKRAHFCKRKKGGVFGFFAGLHGFCKKRREEKKITIVLVFFFLAVVISLQWNVSLVNSNLEKNLNLVNSSVKNADFTKLFCTIDLVKLAALM